MLERVWREKWTLWTIGGNLNWYNHSGKEHGDSLKTNNKTTIWLSNPTTGYKFSSVTESGLTLCDPMDYSTPGFPVHHQFLEPAQTHVHRISDAIQPSHPLSSPSPPTFNLSQYQCLFKWVNSSHQGAKVLELQHQSFQWILRTDFL